MDCLLEDIVTLDKAGFRYCVTRMREKTIRENGRRGSGETSIVNSSEKFSSERALNNELVVGDG